jgi:hypothetical protein
MSYLKPNTAGVYDIGSANIDTLYIRGKKFQDYITELVFEDQFEQGEITEIKLLLEYLDTSGLSSEWIIDNNNKNQDLKTLITNLQTKLANIDTSALTESSVLTNDNRNSVLKTALDTATSDLTALTSRVSTAEGDIDNLETRMTTAETDIDGVETKTRFITEASVSGTGNNTVSNYRTRVGPADGVENGSALIELNMKNGPANQLIGYTIKSNFNNNSYSDNESIYSHRDGRLTLLAETMRLQAADQIRIGNFAEYGDGFSNMAINIGGRGNKINIGRIDSQNPTGDLTEINLGVLGGTGERNTNTSIDGNVYLSGARFDDLSKSTAFTVASLVALMSSGPPAWVVGFFSGAAALPYSDVWCMKGGFAGTKEGDVETSNSIMVSELYVVNKDIVSITPKVGFFLAKADYSCTQLIGDHRTQVFEGEIKLRNNNITSTSVDWAFTDADDKCNVVNIGGDDGILIHQGASDEGAPLRIINSCNGSVKISIHDDGTHGYPYPGLEVKPYDDDGYLRTMTRIGFYPGQNQGNGLAGSYQLEVNQELGRDGIAVIYTDTFGNQGGDKTNKINANSINTPGTITGIDVVGSTSISAPTATAGSLVINANYTGNTDARLYKNADNKLMWNGAEVGAGGVSSGGITYMINVPSNITDPAPSPTETIITAAYSGNAQRTITQAITSNSAFYIAKYTTEVFDEATNPVLTGLQQLNQYISWNSQSHTGQLYGQLWFQATAAGLATLYQRTYASPVTTTAATVLNGTPIPTPKGLYNIKFQRVVFPNINVVVSSGPVVLRYRVEGYDFFNGWVTLTSMDGLAPEVSSTSNNLTITLDESKILNQTSSVGAKTAVRLVLYIASGTGTISQTSAGGADLAAYSLIGLGENTPALFRTMLYDGTNAKISVPYSTTPTLVEYDFAIDVPYKVLAFASPTLSTDLYFIQPSGGGHGTNAVTLYFNEGTISHYHSTISPPQTTPTLAQVLNTGATASQDINMDSHKISGITTLEGAANGNWNVKEITAAEGSGISVTPTNGSYAIANAGIISITAGTGISVSTTDGVAQITNTNVGATQVGVAGTIRDEHQSLYEVGALPQKPNNWATNWSVADSTAVSHRDIYVSVDGKIIVSATGNYTIRYSSDYGTTWSDATGLSATTWTSICGTSNGSKLFAFGTFQAQNQVQSLVLYTSLNQGASWTQITSSAFTGLIKVNRVRCSGDGTYLLASDNTAIQDAQVLYSINGGVTWFKRQIGDLPVGRMEGAAVSASGAIQFATWINNAGDSSRILRSIDYGFTWSEVFGHITGGNWTRIECDATGRFVFATRYVNISTPNVQTYRSDNYGANWTPAGMYGVEDIWVSATGQFVAGVSNPQAGGISYFVYSTDYGRFFTGVPNPASHPVNNTYRTINGSADGSILVLGSVNSTESNFIGDGRLRIARQERPLYTDSGITDSVLWFSGAINETGLINRIALPFTSAGKIDLANYHIRYEIDINWNLESASGSPAHQACFISMGFYGDYLANSNVAANKNVRAANTNWTRKSDAGTNGFPVDIENTTHDSVFNNVFFCGYAAGQGSGTAYRYRTMMKGEISRATTRPEQVGTPLADFAPNSRLVMNRFFADAVLYDSEAGADTLEFYHPTEEGQGQFHIQGTAVWEMSRENKYSVIQNGLDGLFIDLNSTASLTGADIQRRGYITYRIYRVRK